MADDVCQVLREGPPVQRVLDRGGGRHGGASTVPQPPPPTAAVVAAAAAAAAPAAAAAIAAVAAVAAAAADELAQAAVDLDEGARHGLTLVHLSSQPEPSLVPKAPKPPNDSLEKCSRQTE